MDLLAAVVAVLLMRVGFALYAAGLVRAKNSASTVFRVISDLCVAVLAFWLIGGAILFQHHNVWFGFDPQFFGWHIENGSKSSILLFNLVLILTATPVVGGALAERGRFFPICAATMLLAGIVLPATSYVSRTGWLATHGFFDLGGASYLQMAAGVFAAVAAAFVGPRTGKFNRDGSSSMIPGHNVPLTSIGAILLCVGWVAYLELATILRVNVSANASLVPIVASIVVLNVLLAAAAGGFASIVYGQIRYGKPDIVLTLGGFLGGLVSVSAGTYALPHWSALVCGAVAGIIVPMAIVAIDLRARLDDPLGVIAINGVGGAWGTIAAAIFVAQSPTKSHGSQIWIHLVGVVGIALFSALTATALFVVLKATMRLRVKEADEFDGLDLAEHDIGAYPDFQQTTIKSSHLREA